MFLLAVYHGGMSLFAAGLRSSEVPDPPTADSIPLLILYPSEAAEQNETLGPYTCLLYTSRCV